MSEVIDYVYRKCPECGKLVLCDKRDCGCIFGICECGTDIEIEKNCKGVNYERDTV